MNFNRCEHALSASNRYHRSTEAAKELYQVYSKNGDVEVPVSEAIAEHNTPRDHVNYERMLRSNTNAFILSFLRVCLFICLFPEQRLR